MILFQDEDAAYLEFLQSPPYRNGFVLNTTRRRSPYAMIHCAACRSIQGVPTAGQRWTTGDYRKFWAATVAELQSWTLQELGTAAKACGMCRPMSLVEKEENVGSVASPDRGEAGKVVIELAAEGGGETIRRRRSGEDWVYWSEGSSLNMDENDVDYVRVWRGPEAAHPQELLSSFWPQLSPLYIHPEWQDWFRQSYRSFWRGLDEQARREYEKHGNRKRRWTDLVGWVDFPSFYALYSPEPFGKASLYLNLLSLGDHSVDALRTLEHILRTCTTTEREIEALFHEPNWRPHLVAATAVGLGGAADVTLAALWRAFDQGSWVTPQLAAVASLVDIGYDEHARRRLKANVPMTGTDNPKGLTALLALCLQRRDTQDWAQELMGHDAVKQMLAHDIDGGGSIAIDWLASGR